MSYCQKQPSTTEHEWAHQFGYMTVGDYRLPHEVHEEIRQQEVAAGPFKRDSLSFDYAWMEDGRKGRKK